MRLSGAFAAALFLTAIGAVPPAVAGTDARPAPGDPGNPWASALYRDHVLAGRIWAPDTGRFVRRGELMRALKGADFVLLGEKHDNADHHAIQAWTLRELAARGRAPAVVWEMFTTGQAPALERFLAGGSKDADALADAADWAESGWPAWRLYRPVAEAALEAGAPIVAGNLPRESLRRAAREGVAATLGEEAVARMGLDEPVPEAVRGKQRTEIAAGHCHRMPERMLPAMVTIQVLRDAHMAAAMVEAAARPGRDGAVLIAGDGHARRDIGVPWHLARLAPGKRTVSLGLVEVSEGESDPAGYGAAFGAEAPPFDFVWFTPRLAEDDPCAAFADQLPETDEGHGEEAPEAQSE